MDREGRQRMQGNLRQVDSQQGANFADPRMSPQGYDKAAMHMDDDDDNDDDDYDGGSGGAEMRAVQAKLDRYEAELEHAGDTSGADPTRKKQSKQDFENVSVGVFLRVHVFGLCVPLP